MTLVKDTLWGLARGGQPVDAHALAAAVDAQAAECGLDFRTELLIRDALDALKGYWGTARFTSWLGESASSSRLRAIHRSDLGPPGFSTLGARMTDATRPAAILQFLRELGCRLDAPTRLDIGGSAALILQNLLSRHTDDIDVVDEIPANIRSQHALLQELATAHGLRLAHFQSHYLPSGWQDRARSLNRFGRLDVFLVDGCDAFVGKLFSARRKDRDDLRALAAGIDKASAAARVQQSAGLLLAEPRLAANARENWYIIWGDELPA